MVSKAQIWPFLLFSLVVVLSSALLLHWKRLAFLTLIALGIELASWHLFSFLYSTWIANQGVQTAMALDLHSVTVIAPDSAVRKTALKFLLLFGLFLLAGTLMTVWILLKEWPKLHEDRAPSYLIRLGLTAFTASWLAWFLILGVHYTRYLVIPVFASSLFTADLLSRFTNSFDLRGIIRRTGDFLLRHKLTFENGRALLAVILVSISLALNMLTGLFYFTAPQTTNVKQVADYLVLGSTGRAWQVYDQVIRGGNFKLIQSFPGYEVYEQTY